MRLWYLSHRRPVKAQGTLRIHAVSPEPLLFAHMKYESRRRVRPTTRHLASLDGCACFFEEWVYGGRKVPHSHELAHLFSMLLVFPEETNRLILDLFIKGWKNIYNIFEPAHEIMVLFVLHKFILQTCMHSHPMGLDVWFLVGLFTYFHISCVQTATALVRLRRCADLPEPSLVAYEISTMIWLIFIQNLLLYEYQWITKWMKPKIYSEFGFIKIFFSLTL